VSKSHARLTKHLFHCGGKILLARAKLTSAEISLASLKAKNATLTRNVDSLDGAKKEAVASEIFKEAQRLVGERNILEERRRLCNSTIISAADDKVAVLSESAKAYYLQLKEKRMAQKNILGEEARAEMRDATATEQLFNGYKEVFGSVNQPGPSKTTLASVRRPHKPAFVARVHDPSHGVRTARQRIREYKE
jgi:hypothetical protein